MKECRNGHVLDEANTYRHPSGYTRCKACHAERMRKQYARRKVEALPDKIAALQAELDRLRQSYAADPQNFSLSRQVGEASVRFMAARKQAEGTQVLGTRLPQPEPEPAEAYRSGPMPTVYERLAAAPLVTVEWERALPGNRTITESMTVCPGCEGFSSQGGRASAQATMQPYGWGLKCQCSWIWKG